MHLKIVTWILYANSHTKSTHEVRISDKFPSKTQFSFFLEFVLFSLFTCLSIIFLIIHYVPRLGSKHVHIYILIFSLLGAFTVTACKGLGIGLREFFRHEETYSKGLTFSCAIVIIFCILVQMVYLNRALDLFPTPIVTTVYYVLFTTCVLITSGILFREWKQLTLADIFACLMGFCITTCGLILINYLKNNSHIGKSVSKFKRWISSVLV